MESVDTVVISALVQLFDPLHFAYLTGGVLFGLLIGILPGLGGIAGLTILLPYVFGMEPSLALAMMVGMLSATATSDTFPAVLMGIPGTSGSQATVVDGFPLAKKGEGARALGAGFAASMMGGLIGATLLSVAIFGIRPIILQFGFAEQLFLVVFGISMVGILTGRSVFKGLASCCLGLLLGSIGAAPATGDLRATFGSTYLSAGIPLVIVGLSMFAVPEVLDLLRRDRAISEKQQLGSGMLDGVRDTIRNWWIVLRCSAIGSMVGALPGLGGSVVDWIAYGHVVQTSKDRDSFGNGDIRGVIAPESANNAKEGGALIPTLLFGIPGSGAMAVLLGGFVLIGIEPGVGMIRDDLDLTFTIIWSLAIGNILVTLACIALTRPVAMLSTIRYAFIGPFVLVVVVFAAFQATRAWEDVVVLIVLGVLGVLMLRYGWSRAALLIGFVLSARLETSIYQAVQVYGASIFERPIALVLMALSIGVIVVTFIQRRKEAKKDNPPELLRTRNSQIAVSALAFLACGVMLVSTMHFGFMARIFPTSVAIGGLVLTGLVIIQQLSSKPSVPELADTAITNPTDNSFLWPMAWLVGFAVLGYVIGFPLAAFAFTFAYLRFVGGVPIWKSVVAGVCLLAVLGALSEFLYLAYPPGLVPRSLDAPYWLGG
jgi:putative tricarboxylic transport membrane protein